MTRASDAARNLLLETLSLADRELLQSNLEPVTLARRQILFERGDEITNVTFPGRGAIAALVLDMRDGVVAEAAMIGYEGAVGGVISAGAKPAFSRAVVQVPGPAWRLATVDLEKAKARSPTLRDQFACYADCLLAQMLQSVACNAIHAVEARLARWLLATHDRIGADELQLTQEFIAEMLGVQRTYVTRIVKALEAVGAIRTSRGAVTIMDRTLLEQQACECYAYLRRHYERVLPGIYGGEGARTA